MKLLYIGIKFYDYHIKVRNAFEDLGYKVDFVSISCDGLRNSFMRKIKRDFLEKFYSSIEAKILESCVNQNYDVIFVHQGWQLSVDFFKTMKAQNKGTFIVNYHWDSIRAHNYLFIVDYFDKVYSYDPVDCRTYAKIFYLPLFHSNHSEPVQKHLDLVFIGKLRTFYSRYKSIEAIREYAKDKGLKYFEYLLTDRNYYIKSLLKGRVLRGVKFKPLDSIQVARLNRSALAVLDIHDPIKSGLTIRSIEALSAGAKLITTNHEVINEAFYDPEVVQVVDINKLVIDLEWIRKEVPCVNMDSYSLKSWAVNILTK